MRHFPSVLVESFFIMKEVFKFSRYIFCIIKNNHVHFIPIICLYCGVTNSSIFIFQIILAFQKLISHLIMLYSLFNVLLNSDL